jgi:hypothetical protein
MQSQLFVVLLQYEDLWKKNGANSANFQQEIHTKAAPAAAAAAAHSNLVSIRKTNERIEDAFCFFKGSIEEKQQTCSDACWDFGDRRKEIDGILEGRN